MKERHYQSRTTNHKAEHLPVCECAFCLPLTLDGPLKEGLAGLTGGHTVVVAGGHVTAHQTEPFGHRAQHELALHLAFFLPKPPGHKWRKFRENVLNRRMKSQRKSYINLVAPPLLASPAV